MISGSVVSYPERGPWGQNGFRGNFTGYLVKDLIEQFNAKSVLDPFAGSGTTKDVCDELGIYSESYDLKDGFDAVTLDLGEKRFDLVILHPPYWRMIQYSEDPRDLSNAESLQEFLNRLSQVILRLAGYLTKDGRIVVVIGNWRHKGTYYPLGACIEVLFMRELKDELIKVQHHTRSSGNLYGGSFIPIMHEKVLLLQGFKSQTWEELLIRALKQLGGTGTLNSIYETLESEPKTLDNPSWRATIRREAQEHLAPGSERGTWSLRITNTGLGNGHITPPGQLPLSSPASD